jgi:hypothetical protein
MSKRTDTHRPSAINPADYDFVACDYLGGGIDAIEFQPERVAFREHMTRTAGKFAEHHNNGSCHICGAAALYVARYHHVPSNTYITTGMDCAEKMEIGEAVLFASFRKRIRAGLKVAAGKRKAQELLNANELAAAWVIYTNPTGNDRNDMIKREEAVIYDIVGKLVRYGTISDGQTNYLRVLLGQIERRAEVERQRRAEQESADPVPVTSDRVSVAGVVLTTKMHEGDFGPVRKMLVKCDAGYKLYGSVPRELSGELKGARVEFTARIQRSPDDVKFGFFSRPTKARIVETVTAVS